MSHNTSLEDFPQPSETRSISEQQELLKELRHRVLQQYRPLLQQGSGPIRVMARMVNDLERQARALQISEEVIKRGIVNRTIGDIDLRRVIECEGELGGPGDYRMLADELGIALPGEIIAGYTATGETYYWIREQMLDLERAILARGFDIRIYDILGTGNPVLREWLSQDLLKWGIQIPSEQIFLGLGAMDSIDKVLRGLRQTFREQQIEDVAVLFPAPNFTVPEWQARSYGYRLQHFQTNEEHNYKMTGAQLNQALQEHPDIRIIYLTITNNPTAMAFTPDELDDLHQVVKAYRQKGRQVIMLADLAYIGTGKPEEDLARMCTFAHEEILRSTIFVHSFSKTHTLTGERFGWVSIGDPQIAPAIAPGWTNSMASLPADWQLRFMAFHRLIAARPWLNDKLRAFYRLRRNRFIDQLKRIDEEQHLFEHINQDDDATVYNWSKVREGEDTFSVFEKTGIAGVPGSGFGYSDNHIRFSIGVIPIL